MKNLFSVIIWLNFEISTFIKSMIICNLLFEIYEKNSFEQMKINKPKRKITVFYCFDNLFKIKLFV